MSRRRFLVNAPARALRRNRMQRPTAAYRKRHPLIYQRDWGEISPAEAAKIYDVAMAKGAPSWLRPPEAREKLPAPYDREQARREYLAAVRGPIKHGHRGEQLALGRNPGAGRRFTFHGSFSSKADAQRKEREVGGFIRPQLVGGRKRYLVLTPKRRRGKAGHNPGHLEARNMARRRSRSRRRKGSARRSRRRAAARVTLSTNPRRAARRHRASSRRSHRGHRRSFRRNPPGGIFGRLVGAVMNGVTISAGQLGQNAIVRYVPDVIPATVPQAGLINGLLKDVAGILAGSYLAHSVIGARRAEFFVGGQASAAVNRVIRAANIPTVSTLLGEYDPIRIGVYTRGTTRALPAAAAGGQATAGNVKMLKSMGVYTDGVSYSPSLY